MSNKKYDEEIWKYFWQDTDNQDGKYYEAVPPYRKEDHPVYDSEIISLSVRKNRATLYLRAHYDEIKDIEPCMVAFQKLIDQSAREISCFSERKPLPVVPEEVKQGIIDAIDLEIGIQGLKKIESYKNDAYFIVKKIYDDKGLII